MIKAAALYAVGQGEAPPELELYLAWEHWGVLPEPGGIRSQRYGELRRMKAAHNAYLIWRAWCYQEEGWEKLAIRDDTAPVLEWIEELLDEQ